jgi:hypothetical protein
MCAESDVVVFRRRWIFGEAVRASIRTHDFVFNLTSPTVVRFTTTKDETPLILNSFHKVFSIFLFGEVNH